jgi:hypothetical protein
MLGHWASCSLYIWMSTALSLRICSIGSLTRVGISVVVFELWAGPARVLQDKVLDMSFKSLNFKAFVSRFEDFTTEDIKASSLLASCVSTSAKNKHE